MILNYITQHWFFGQPFVKRFALCYWTIVLSVLSVCDVVVRWSNGSMDQDETWHADRPRPWPHCVGWGPSQPPPPKTHSPQFSSHISCGQMAGWIKMPLGMLVGLSPVDCVRWGPNSSLPKRGRSSPSIF